MWVTKQFDIGLAWKFKKVRQCQCCMLLKFCSGAHPYKVITWCMQFLRRCYIPKTDSPWARLKVQKGCIKVNIKTCSRFWYQAHLCKFTTNTRYATPVKICEKKEENAKNLKVWKLKWYESLLWKERLTWDQWEKT